MTNHEEMLNEGSRLKGTLLTEGHQRYEARAPRLIGDLSKLDVIVSGGEFDAVEPVGPATLVPNLSLEGLVHISASSVESFEEDQVGPNGKFGKGTYFAAGALTGETYSLLNQPGNVVHSAAVSGSVLFVDRDQVSALAGTLREQAGIPASVLKTSIKNADLTGLIEQAGVSADAVIVFMDPEHTAAEIAVLPHATSQLEITDRVVL